MRLLLVGLSKLRLFLAYALSPHGWDTEQVGNRRVIVKAALKRHGKAKLVASAVSILCAWILALPVVLALAVPMFAGAALYRLASIALVPMGDLNTLAAGSRITLSGLLRGEHREAAP